jgi:acetylxylan esterase
MPYSGSIPVGVANMKKAITTYTQSCPQSKLVLMGYSQGGAVMVDTLCGGGGPQVGPATPGLTLEEGKLIKAAVSMGDPRFVPGTSYDLGTNKGKGGVSRFSMP